MEYRSLAGSFNMLDKRGSGAQRGGDPKRLHGTLDGRDIIAIHHLFSAVKYNGGHNLAFPGLVPLFVKLLAMLNIPFFKRNLVPGEIPFHLGAVASAIGNINNNPLL